MRAHTVKQATSSARRERLNPPVVPAAEWILPLPSRNPHSAKEDLNRKRDRPSPDQRMYSWVADTAQCCCSAETKGCYRGRLMSNL